MGQQRALGAREGPSLAWGPLNLPGGGDASISLETQISLPGIPATPLSSGSLPTPPPPPYDREVLQVRGLGIHLSAPNTADIGARQSVTTELLAWHSN